MPIHQDLAQSSSANLLPALIRSTLERSGPGLYGVKWPAGVGKSVASSSLAASMEAAVYSADYRFIGNSLERRILLIHKQTKSINGV